MPQKVLRVGKSAAVTIPKKSLDDLGLHIGDQVSVEVDIKKKSMIITRQKALSKQDEKIARLTADFIDRYRKDLVALAGK